MSRSWAASTEPKSADFCQDRPSPGAVPRPIGDVMMTSLRHFTHFSVQMDLPPQGSVPRPGKSKKADLGSSEGRAPFGDAVRERLIGRPLEI